MVWQFSLSASILSFMGISGVHLIDEHQSASCWRSSSKYYNLISIYDYGFSGGVKLGRASAKSGQKNPRRTTVLSFGVFVEAAREKLWGDINFWNLFSISCIGMFKWNRCILHKTTKVKRQTRKLTVSFWSSQGKLVFSLMNKNSYKIDVTSSN